MARIAGVDLPRNKRIEVAMTYIYGIGRTTSQILSQAGVDFSARTDDLTESELVKIRELVDQNCNVEGDLRREITMNIKRLMDLAAIADCAIVKGLPVHGQNTKNNSRTVKVRRKQ